MTVAIEQARGERASESATRPGERPLVVHVITGLNVGGAERMLLKLVPRLDADFAQAVVSLTGRGKLAAEIERFGIEVYDVGIRSWRSVPFGLWRLLSWLKRHKPAVVQTWMFHADLLGGLAARMAGIQNVAWNLRATALDQEKTSVRVLQKANAFLARYLPRIVVSCGRRVSALHEEHGYPAGKMRVIPNGFNLAVFAPNEENRRQFRSAIGIPEDSPVVGTVGRLHAMKDYQTFFDAARVIRSKVPQVRFLLAGRGLAAGEPSVTRWVGDAGLTDVVHLLGEQRDLAPVYNAMDVFVLSSACSEGFPNVVGEGMASGIPCVVTDVGDAAWIVGDSGIVVAPRDPTGLADAVVGLLVGDSHDRVRLGVRARQRIEQHFGIDRVANEYAELYREFTRRER